MFRPAVWGGEYLHTGRLNADSWLSTSAIGLWHTIVLNLNNMRGIEYDWAVGKRTLAVRLGLPRAKHCHRALAFIAAICRSVWLAQYFHGFSWPVLQVFMLTATFVHLNLLDNTPSSLKPGKLLPQWGMTGLAFSVCMPSEFITKSANYC
ncbi:prenyltransferase [Neisseria yangbaofengii]|uniref:prenyltransferase n=1 Tax=Neisseria yangbaofengii TaxID=2709396 RepID=UPI003BA134BE